MVKVIKDIKELEMLLMGRWYNPERVLYNWIIRNESPYNRLRFIRALVRNLQRKGVILLPEVIRKIYEG